MGNARLVGLCRGAEVSNTIVAEVLSKVIVELGSLRAVEPLDSPAVSPPIG